MPSITAANTATKTEKVSALDVPESFKAAATVIEKKCRNLEKRKVSFWLCACVLPPNPCRDRCGVLPKHAVVMPVDIVGINSTPS